MGRKVTDAWCVKCHKHADIVQGDELYCAKCYLETESVE